ncbi:hypothetical protein [Cohnella hashimotonis]|uniref:Lipoprotein n=1 Tax=Cohnella hashimotonis TaxID=2826895 RepID=A0ABT6TAJ2_9BACL|nr:hypothetical protein [Cohnella hashimotonis]MDI4643576.1 hypothetical protein [Cohnella hashimotonis]
MKYRKWNLLGVGLLSAAVLAGCGESKEEQARKAIAEGFSSAFAAAEASASAMANTPEGKLNEIDSYLTSELWNDGFVDVSWYISSGTSSTGDTMDIDFTIERLGQAVSKKAAYDSYVQGLDDSKYAAAKQTWLKLSPEIDRLYNQLKEKAPAANDASYSFDTGLYKQYSEAFTEEVEKLNN